MEYRKYYDDVSGEFLGYIPEDRRRIVSITSTPEWTPNRLSPVEKAKLLYKAADRALGLPSYYRILRLYEGKKVEFEFESGLFVGMVSDHAAFGEIRKAVVFSKGRIIEFKPDMTNIMFRTGERSSSLQTAKYILEYLEDMTDETETVFVKFSTSLGRHHRLNFDSSNIDLEKGVILKEDYK